MVLCPCVAAVATVFTAVWLGLGALPDELGIPDGFPDPISGCQLLLIKP